MDSPAPGLRLDLSRLECVRVRGTGVTEAACPACREMGRDSTGNHLAVFADGRFACARHPGDKAHLARVLQLVGIDWKEAGRREKDTRHPSPPLHRPRPPRPSPAPFDLAAAIKRNCLTLRHSTPEDFATLATLRSVNPEAVRLAEGRGLLLFGKCLGRPSWIIRDRPETFFQARRMDGGTWPAPVLGGKDYKAHTIGRLRPVGIQNASIFPRVAIVEGGADVLAACQFIWAEDAEAETGLAMMPGTSARFSPDDLALLAGKPVRIFPHHDATRAGRDAAEGWGRALVSAGCRVDLVDVSAFATCTGKPACDLNELTGHNGTGGMTADAWEHSPLARNLMSF